MTRKRADASPPEFADGYDLGDLQDDAAAPTANLITVTLHPDGTASFELPRAEVGQGITTSSAMLIAEELDLPITKITVTLADARPELVYNQLTGGSNTTRSTYLAIRTAAALARLKLIEAAAAGWNLTDLSKITTNAGVVKNAVTKPVGELRGISIGSYFSGRALRRRSSSALPFSDQ